MRWFVPLTVIFCLVLSACSTNADEDPAGKTYVMLAWNDLGMHCLNPSYDTAVVLPPYNDLWVQVIEKGNPPRIVTSGITVEYRFINNSYSYGKRNFGQFWDYCPELFGVTLPQNLGLNLADPDLHNGLSGMMLAKGDHFVVDGVPLTPIYDDGSWNPYQNAEFVARDSGGREIARTRTTAPTSEEMNCSRCHGSNAFAAVLREHDDEHGTSLYAQRPVLCARCHGSPALGQSGPGSSGKYLSQVMHGGHHAEARAACYDCHPGAKTKCMRSVKHMKDDGNCVACHGTMAQVASSISKGGRIPWLNEPKCSLCHKGGAGVDTGTVLYRNAIGHGGLYCAACHSSPHAILPSTREEDNYQAITLQGKANTIGSCAACHDSSRGEGIEEFAEAHGGSSPEKKSACHICHTVVPTNTALWPHAFTWKDRTL